MIARDRRAIKWGVTAIFLVFLTLRVVPDFLGRVTRMGDRLNAKQQLLARGRWDIAQIGVLEDSVQSVQRALSGVAPQLLSGGDEVEAGESLEGVIKMAATNNARIDDIEFVPDSMRAGHFSRATIRASLESDLPGLLAVLGHLSSGDPVVRVLSLQVMASNPDRPEEAQVLRAQLLLEGWFLDQNRREGLDGG